MSLLVVGSVAYDALESPYGKVERTLGGAATYFSISASFFTHVNLVAIVGEDFHPKDEAIFHKRSIDIEGLERAAGKCFFWAGRYSENLNERVDSGHGAQCLRRLQTSAARKISQFQVRVPRQHRSVLAARRLEAGQRHPEACGHGYHELLDRRQQRRPS